MDFFLGVQLHFTINLRILLLLLTQMKAAAPADQAGAAAFVSVTLHVFVDIPELKIWKLAIEQRW